MALEEYKRKRSFDRTPEPPPKLDPKKGFRFVDQKHRVSHLHYDLRLGKEGMLKSWAVPKGPSLDPSDKRLAMQVEDHPVSYFHFEGIIPPNNYGAGTVMVWDTGTWEPLKEDYSDHAQSRAEREKQASAMLAKGDLKFRLHGQKLKGDFVLAKMRSRRPGSKGTEWLLIKKRDEQAVSGYDIDRLDYSVLTQRSLKEIAGDRDAQWQSNRPPSPGSTSAKNAWLADAVAKHDRKVAAARAANGKARKKTADSAPARAQAPPEAAALKSSSRNLKKKDEFGLDKLKGAANAPMPRQIHPMLATPVEEAFDSDDWLFEIKWDGYRSVVFFSDDGKRSFHMVSRNQNEQTDDFPELHIIANQ